MYDLNAQYLCWSPARPSCLTHLIWCPGSDLIAHVEEYEEAVGDPQPLVKWQADDVM